MARHAIKKLTLREVSVVDDPDNALATIDIVKSKEKAAAEDIIGKMRTFAEGFQMRRRWGDMQEIATKARDAVDALQSSVGSIFDDPQVTDKRSAIAQQVTAAVAKINEVLSTFEVVKSAGGSDAAIAADHVFKETIMDIEKIQASLEAAEEAVEKATKAAEEATAKAADLEKQVKAKDEEIAKLKGDASKSEDGSEDIFKGMTPAAKEAFVKLQKANDANEKALAKMQSEKDEATEIAKARAAGLPDPDKTGPLMVRIAKGKTTEEDVALVQTILKGAAAQARQGAAILKVVGSRGNTDAGSAEAELDTKAQEIQKAAGGKKTYAEAYGEAIDQNPDLYQRYTVEKRRRAAAVGDDGE